MVVNARDGAALDVAVVEIKESTGAVVHAVPFDVTDPAAVSAGIAHIEETVGPLDVV